MTALPDPGMSWPQSTSAAHAGCAAHYQTADDPCELVGPLRIEHAIGPLEKQRELLIAV
jgi:hypothetical protein